MGTYNGSLTKIRRFLRDPNANIWSNDFLRRAWNEMQQEFAQKCGMLETVNVWPWPPQWTYSYMHDWEHAYAEGDRFQELSMWQADSKVVCYPWEPAYWLPNVDTADSNYRFTIPWEAGIALPADIVPLPLHEQIQNVKFAAFDEAPITPISQRELSGNDPYYRTTTGRTTNYWRPDNYHNQFVLYPRPASVVWQELAAPDSFADTGGINNWLDSSLDQSGTGIVTNTFVAADAVLMVFEFLPYDVSDDDATWDDELEWPEYVLHYIEAGVLERAFAADTDGHIPSLRDYWRLRKDIGINAMKRFKVSRLKDRVFQIGRQQQPARSRLRLPDGYPAI